MEEPLQDARLALRTAPTTRPSPAFVRLGFAIVHKASGFGLGAAGGSCASASGRPSGSEGSGVGRVMESLLRALAYKLKCAVKEAIQAHDRGEAAYHISRMVIAGVPDENAAGPDGWTQHVCMRSGGHMA